MVLALNRDQNHLSTSYAYVSSNRGRHPTPPRYYTPSRSSFKQTSKTEEPIQHIVGYIAPVSQLLFKAILIAVMSIGFVYCASALVGSSSSVLLKVLGLSIWSCGFVPLSYYLWNSKLTS